MMAHRKWKTQSMLALLVLVSTSLLSPRTVTAQEDGGGPAELENRNSSASNETTYCVCNNQDDDVVAINDSNCTFAVPGLPENFAYNFKEIAALPREAELTLTWDKPANYSALCYYELRIKGTSTDLECERTEDFLMRIDKDTTNLTLSTTTFTADNFSLSLLYECRYQLSIVSFPRSENITENIYIKHNRKSILSIDCIAIYQPENVNYNIFANWSLDDPLATEAASVNGFRIRLRKYPEFMADMDKEILESNYTFTNHEVILESDSHYIVEVEFRCLDRKAPFFWRKPLLDKSCSSVVNPYTCITDALPRPPTPLENIQINETAYFPFESTLRVTITWELPIFPNGVLLHHQLRIGTIPISPQENTLESSTVFEETEIKATDTSISNDILLNNRESDEIYIQMRSKNNYNLYSDWSTPIVVDLQNITVDQPTFVLTEMDFVRPLPGYAIGVIAVVMLLFLGVVMLSVALCCVCVRKNYCIHIGSEMMPMGKGGSHRIKDHGPFFLINHTHTQVDEWEIAEDEITVFKDQPLGEGCFGKVFKGMLMGQSLKNRPKGNFRPPIFSLTCTVAIKQLKTDAHGSEKENFFKEMKMMKMVSSAENEMKKFVVNMVGCITIKEPLLLVVEYVRHGDLQTFLRTIKKQTIVRFARQQSEAAPYLEPEGVYSELNPSNEMYAELGALEERNLLEFARQIAAGMEFLSGLGVIHRDLACRNILIGEQKNLKISDFGMSRYLPKDEVYVPMSHGLLPLRWMAIESIHAREFTTASDIWSYGIVLWELCTMCDFPYKTIPNHELLGFLRHGYRMPKPNNCSPEVYDIILQCWREEQQNRPSFSDLRSWFDKFLSIYVQDHYPYIELESSDYYDKLQVETNSQTGDLSLFPIDARGSSSADDLQTRREQEDKGSPGSPPKGGPLSENNGRLPHRSPLPQQKINRLSVLSDTMQQLSRLAGSNQDLRSNSSSVTHLDLINREGIQSLPRRDTQGGSFRSLNDHVSEFVDLRYVESPVAALSRSSVLLSSDLSLEREVIGQMQKKAGELKLTGSYPDCSQESEPGNGVCKENGAVRSKSFSTDKRKMFKRENTFF